MKKIVLLTFVLVLLLSMVFGACFSPLLAANPETTLYMEPVTVIANLGENFTVYIKIADVEYLWAYEFRLEWDSTLLDVVNVTEGTFLNANGTYFTFFIWKDDFPSIGHLYVACTLLGEPASAAASGNGTLAIIEFQALDEGNCTLDLYNTHLANPYEHEIEHTAEDVHAQIIPEFPTLTSMLLLLILLTVAIAIYKRKLFKTPIH